MPQLIDRLEERRRKTRRSVYFIQRYARADEDAIETLPNPPSFEFPQVLRAWLDEHLPGVASGRIGPSEYSGWIVGGPMLYFLDLDVDSAQRYAEYWEHPNQVDATGRRLDQQHGFECYVLPFESWRRRLDACEVRTAPPDHHIERLVFWDTPSLGLLWTPWPHLGRESGQVPAVSPADLWIRAQETFPALMAHSPDLDVVTGQVTHAPGAQIECVVSLPMANWSESHARCLGPLELELCQGAHSAWQRKLCEYFTWPADRVLFSSYE